MYNIRKLYLIVLLVIIPIAIAEMPPFQQCIDVQDKPGGYFQCTYLDTNQETIMSNGSWSLYCITINNTYSEGTYNYEVNCTDGDKSKKISNSLHVGGSSGSPSGATSFSFPDKLTEAPNLTEQFWQDLLTKNPIILMAIYLGLFFLINQFTATKFVKAPSRP